MVSRGDIDHMANIIAIMNGQKPTTPLNESRSPSLDLPSVDPTDDMKNILSRMYEAGGESVPSPKTEKLTESYTSYDFDSEYTVRVDLKEGSKTRRLYSVVNGNQIITEGFYLFESAFLIAHMLNNGSSLTSKNVIKILEEDEEYRDAIKEASILKSRINKCKQLNESEARSVFERKFKIAKAEAEAVHDLLKSKINSIF